MPLTSTTTRKHVASETIRGLKIRPPESLTAVLRKQVAAKIRKMYTVKFNPEKGWSYDAKTKTFLVSEKDLGAGFATDYAVMNPKTGVGMNFIFDHSTGGEFEPTTKWVYYSPDHTMTLEVANDPAWARQAAKDYLNAKLRK